MRSSKRRNSNGKLGIELNELAHKLIPWKIEWMMLLMSLKTRKMTNKTQENIESLRAKSEDLENRTRRSNIRIRGLPESIIGRWDEGAIEVGQDRL